MSKRIDPIASGSTGRDANITDKNDCTVRALANATGMAYAEAHRKLALAGRKEGKGVHISAYHPVYVAAGATATFHGPRGRKEAKRYRLEGAMETGRTLERVVRENPAGRHIVIVTGHAVALVDGQLLDTYPNPAGKLVRAIYTFSE